MSSRSPSTADAGEIREVLRGAVDLYVHTKPELLKRFIDDVTLAKQMKADGFRAAMLWIQFSHSGERAANASALTGFDMRGSIILNGTVGGLDPIVTEYAIRMGARYVSMPTMSGSAYQARITDYAADASALAGPVPVIDDKGAVLPRVHDVLDVVAKNDVVLGLGYLSFKEAMAVLKAAKQHRIRKIAVLRPYSDLGFTAEQVEEAMAVPDVFLEFPSSSVQASSGAAGLAVGARAVAEPGPAAPAIAAAIKRYGADRCVLMSDTGWNDLTALEWFTAACTTLSRAGIGSQELRRLVRDTPAQLIGVN